MAEIAAPATHRKAMDADTATPDPMRAPKSTMVAAADMCAVPVAAAVPMSTTMSTTMPAAVAATSGDRSARQRHRKHKHRNSNCALGHGILLRHTAQTAA